MVLTLAADVPSGITPLAVLPANFRSFLPQPQFGYPCIFTNQDYALPLGDLTATTELDYLTIGEPLVLARQPWWYAVRNNDSGSGAFMLINGVLVFVTDWRGAGTGPAIADNLAQVQAAIDANWAYAGFPGSPHTLSQVDLSAFASY